MGTFVKLLKDIYGYLAAFLLMGKIRMTNQYDYWDTSKYLGSSVKNIISRNKFLFVSKYLHINDNSKSDGSILYKINPLQEIIDNWSKYYSPSKEITLDESVVPFYGRSGYTVYNPAKPDKWGYKCFTLSDSWNAYCLNLLVYSGTSFQNISKVYII